MQCRSSSRAELARDCGYYDQAHFNRGFRALAGCTPGEYLGRSLPDGCGVAER
jgi:AraC-like DNA-binding protein